jgi:YD repeat-containing protein
VNRLRAILVGLILGLPMLLAQSRSPEENSAAMSDRVQAGLRGPVKSSHEESSYPNITDAAGKALEVRFEHTTVYDPDGRILSARSRNSDGSQWVTRYEYSNSGQLLKIASGTEGQALTETTYSYDPQGRIEKITTNGRTETPVFFRYDEHGGKAKVQTSRASDYRPNVATGGSPFEAADMAPNLPDGGTTTTIYDGHDRPTEVQVRDTNGELVNRALRTYDAQGHVSEEKQIYDNLATMFPPETRQKLLDDSGLSADQLRQELHAQLTTLMKGQAEPYSVSYRYDSGGRLVHTGRRIFNHEDEIDTTYNEQGDTESEITRSTRPEPENEPTAPGPQSSYSETRYSYQYDQHGNWTEKTVSYRSSSDAAFQSSTVIKRSLTYY